MVRADERSFASVFYCLYRVNAATLYKTHSHVPPSMKASGNKKKNESALSFKCLSTGFLPPLLFLSNENRESLVSRPVIGHLHIFWSVWCGPYSCILEQHQTKTKRGLINLINIRLYLVAKMGKMKMQMKKKKRKRVWLISSSVMMNAEQQDKW